MKTAKLTEWCVRVCVWVRVRVPVCVLCASGLGAGNILTEMLLFIKPGTRSPQMIPLDARAEEMKLALFNGDN